MNLWLIGAGQMAQDYAKVLNALDARFEVIGRGVYSASNFFNSTGLITASHPLTLLTLFLITL